MLEVIPGILEKNWSEIERKINLVKGFAKTASNAAAAIHIDIIDGKFAPNATFIDPLPFKKYAHSASSGQALFFELHMMVDNPIQYLKPFADAGFKRFLGHIERMPDQEEFVARGQALGEVGLAIDGPTPLSTIKVPYQDLDSVLVMTIKAGESGQEFNPEYLKKVEILRQAPSGAWLRSSQSDLAIEVDGGINVSSIVEAKNAGANRFVSTTFIFNPLKDSGPQAQFNLLKERISQ